MSENSCGKCARRPVCRIWKDVNEVLWETAIVRVGVYKFPEEDERAIQAALGRSCVHYMAREEVE